MNTVTRVLSTAAAATVAAGVVTVASPGAAFAQGPCVQNVAVINIGAYQMSFVASNRTGITSTPTDSYIINDYRVIDLTATPIPLGDEVRPVVSATAGETAPADEFVTYCANGQTATYSASGYTTNVVVTLQR